MHNFRMPISYASSIVTSSFVLLKCNAMGSKHAQSVPNCSISLGLHNLQS